MALYLSEQEIEEAISWNTDILISNSKINESIYLLDRQHRLPSGKRIDLLYEKGENGYLIVELKAEYVKDISVFTNQILEYKKELSEEKNISKSNIDCILASSRGFSEKVIEKAEDLEVNTIYLDEEKLSQINLKNEITRMPFILNKKALTTFKLISLRLDLNHNEILNKIIEGNKKVLNCLESTSTLIEKIESDEENIEPDEYSKKRIAEIFRTISRENSIFAHEIGKDEQTYVKNNENAWFWFFYSVQDWRANANRFIKAKKLLENEGIYRPRKIVKLVKNESKKKVIKKIANILEPHGLLPPHPYTGKLAKPKSITEAAIFLDDFDFKVNNIYENYLERCEDKKEVYSEIWDQLQDVYGMGERTTAQFIRGMVIKGTWELPLDDKRQLEICKYNVRFASKEKIGLVKSKEDYENKLLKFSERYLDGNNGIISHALWVVRKKYCYKKMECDICPLNGYCLRNLRKINNSEEKKLEDIKQRKLTEFI